MKALSFSQPWLWAILRAGKHVENRSWPPPPNAIGQRLVLHAAKSWDQDAVGFMTNLGIEMPNHRDMYPAGAIVGVATITSVVWRGDKNQGATRIREDLKRWFFGEYGWLLSDVVSFDPILGVKGALGLWQLPPDLESIVNERLASFSMAETPIP